MLHEADFAFRQAWALGPDSPAAVSVYAGFLLAQSRVDDAVLVGETALDLLRARGVHDDDDFTNVSQPHAASPRSGERH
jgi:hypothetical protein